MRVLLNKWHIKTSSLVNMNSRLLVKMLDLLQMKMIVVMREPKDWIYSAARKIMENPTAFGRVKETPIEQYINDCLFGFSCVNGIGRLPMVDRYALMEKWSQYSFVLTIKFEDLVGPQGGGTSSAMENTIRKIANHINVAIDDTDLDAIQNALFGGTKTFRKGQIGSWKEYEPLFTTSKAKRIIEHASHFYLAS